jgi:hypothetical protein
MESKVSCGKSLKNFKTAEIRETSKIAVSRFEDNNLSLEKQTS